jgi:hypothetical protein
MYNIFEMYIKKAYCNKIPCKKIYRVYSEYFKQCTDSTKTSYHKKNERIC